MIVLNIKGYYTNITNTNINSNNRNKKYERMNDHIHLYKLIKKLYWYSKIFL